MEFLLNLDRKWNYEKKIGLAILFSFFRTPYLRGCWCYHQNFVGTRIVRIKIKGSFELTRKDEMLLLSTLREFARI